MVALLPSFLLFTGTSDHESVNTIAREFGTALSELGCAVDVVDLRDADYGERIRSVVSRGPAIAISVAGMGMDMRPSGNLYGGPALRLVSMLLDHPLHHWDQLSLALPRRLVTVIAPEDAAFVQRHLPGTECTFLPHGAPELRGLVPWSQRDIAILLCAARPQPSEILRNGWAAHGETTRGRLERIRDRLVLETGAPPHPVEVIGAVLAEEGIAAPPLALHPFFVTIDRYLRALERERAVEQLAGLPLTLAGPGWEGGLGPVPLVEVRAMMGRAKVVLNPMPAYHASHERVFAAMAAGAVAVTPPNSFVADLPVAAVRESWGGTVASLLADPAGAEALALAGHAAAGDGHTMRHRASALLDWIR